MAELGEILNNNMWKIIGIVGGIILILIVITVIAMIIANKRKSARENSSPLTYMSDADRKLNEEMAQGNINRDKFIELHQDIRNNAISECETGKTKEGVSTGKPKGIYNLDTNRCDPIKNNDSDSVYYDLK